jgi:hypothetical protein
VNDLVVLAADRNIEFAMRGILERHQAIGIRGIRFDIYVHPERDPGCRHHGAEFLRPFQRRHHHALVVFDREGSGKQRRREEIEAELDAQLGTSGWGERAAAIVIDPEVEQWVWSQSPAVEEVLGWAGRDPSLGAWLRQERWWHAGAPKPHRPKEAMQAALRMVGKPRSSSQYRALASKVTLQRCQDPAFLALLEVLRRWFRPSSP